MNKLLSVSVSIFALLAIAGGVRAAEIEITCNPDPATSCDVVPSDTAPVFDPVSFPENDLKPGDNFTRKIKVTNNRPEVCHFTIDNFVVNENTEVLEGYFFSDELKTEFSHTGGTTGEMSFTSLFANSPLFVGDLAANEVKEFDWRVAFDKDAGNEFQRAILEFDFDWTFSCGERETILIIEKSNNTGGATLLPGSSVLYTLVIKTPLEDVNDVYVVDVSPEGFDYRLGTWTANSNFRGNLKPNPTSEPTYASPGLWYLGDMEVGEEVTLTYIADIDSGVDPGTYPDLAWAYGDFDGGSVLSNVTYDPQYFVGTQVIVDYDSNPSASFGTVLGASTEVLPATGASAKWIIIAGILLITGVTSIYYGRKISKKA